MEPNTPTTPVRPSRSIHRLTIHSLPSELSLTPTLTSESINISPETIETFSQIPSSPSTAPSSFEARHKLTRKSTTSIPRKPVPLDAELDTLPRTSHESLPSSPVVQHRSHSGVSDHPPMYILPVDPPLPPSPASSDSGHHHPISTLAACSTLEPPSYPTVENQQHSQLGGSEMVMHEDLPTYTEETQTEPKTLARGLWLWGFACPLLWIIGICIFWIPLKPVEEESDPEKAQKLEEMIQILRKTELQYAKRCAYALAGLGCLILVIVVICVVVSMNVKP